MGPRYIIKRRHIINLLSRPDLDEICIRHLITSRSSSMYHKRAALLARWNDDVADSVFNALRSATTEK